MNFPLSTSLGSAALGLALAVVASGCGSETPVGGLTNPNAGSVVDRDKPATRTDLPAPDLNAGRKEPIAESAATSPSSADTGQPEVPQTSAPATPAAKENSGEASGGTRPAGPIKDGTPKGPQ